MTVVTWFMKKSRLSQMVDTAGGTTVVSALRAAEVNNLALKDEALAAVDATLAELDRLTASTPEDPKDWLARIYGLASDLLDVSGPFGLDDMCKGVYSLCELVDRQKRQGRCDLPPILVHVRSLRLLRQPDQPAEASAQILAGLEAVLARSSRVREGLA
ncbi:MAG: hypothetical protein Q8L66_12790 [Caulobacter sp.]|nr:hypothetical protein [Caulobacter sp.]